ncbi:MAG: sugar ABC transporter permease YjfF [Lachnospiraceae bacterium]|nr:sugar ABC transporter permease YjfF [Lachnospiraceae bacterium]
MASFKKLSGLKKKVTGMTDTSLLLTITVLVFFAMYLGAVLFLGEGFLKPQTFFNMLNQNAALLIVSCGMTLVMITGGIDISVGGVVALVSMCCAINLDCHGGNIFQAILISLVIGLLFGIVQGYLVAYLEIQPFIVTLAGMFFARGMTTIVCEKEFGKVIQFNVENEAFVKIKDTRINMPEFLGTVSKRGVFIPAYIELGVIVAILIVLILFCVLRWTKTGRKFYAVGGNNQSALMLGVNVKRTKFTAHVICGLLAGVGGFVYFLHIGSGSPTHAAGMEMNAIASSIIGGTMLSGGIGSIIGALFGVLSLSTIKDIVSSMGFDENWWTGITVAAMLCLFLIIQSIVMARKSSAGSKIE